MKGTNTRALESAEIPNFPQDFEPIRMPPPPNALLRAIKESGAPMCPSLLARACNQLHGLVSRFVHARNDIVLAKYDELKEGAIVKVSDIVRMRKEGKIGSPSQKMADAWRRGLIDGGHAVFVPPLTVKEKSQLKALHRKLGEHGREWLYHTLTHWQEFASFVRTRTGQSNVPGCPHIGFCLKHALHVAAFCTDPNTGDPNAEKRLTEALKAAGEPLQKPEPKESGECPIPVDILKEPDARDKVAVLGYDYDELVAKFAPELATKE